MVTQNYIKLLIFDKTRAFFTVCNMTEWIEMTEIHLCTAEEKRKHKENITGLDNEKNQIVQTQT